MMIRSSASDVKTIGMRQPTMRRANTSMTKATAELPEDAEGELVDGCLTEEELPIRRTRQPFLVHRAAGHLASGPRRPKGASSLVPICSVAFVPTSVSAASAPTSCP
jgi:hypothetical protein